MQLEIHGTNVPVSPSLIQHAEQRIGAALARLSDQVDRVVIRFSREGTTVSAAHHGIERVDVALALASGPVVRIENVGRDPYHEVAVAAARAREVIVRRLGRMRARRRR